MSVDSLFLVLTGFAILSPGPSVIFTITNTLRYGLPNAIVGVFGNAVGVLIVAGISASGIGLLLTTSVQAYSVFKFISVTYLFYLGLRLWRVPYLKIEDMLIQNVSIGTRFIEGALLQLTNPYVIFFILTVFPQFIDPKPSYALQFATLSFTYGTLVVFIHCLYALFAKSAMKYLTPKNGCHTMNKLGAITFMVFGTVLAISNL